MENCVERLNYLIALKKTKKDANKLERDEFFYSWIGLIERDGFSEQVEGFLYNGFTYCGAKPLKEYMKKQDSQVDILRKLFQGKLYGENCASTTQILIHLLALSINESQKDLDVIATIIHKIPSALRNKEGKIYGQFDRTVKKYFLDEIRPDAEFPDFVCLVEHGLEYSNAVSFGKQMLLIIENMDIAKFSNKCKANIDKVKKWINPPKQDRGEMSEKETVEPVSELQNVACTANEESDGLQTEKAVECNSTVIVEENVIYDIETLEKKLELLAEQKQLLEKKIELNDKQSIILKKDLETKDKELSEARECIIEKNKTIHLLQMQLVEIKRQFEELQEDNLAKKQEIEQRIELIEMLRRDRSKQGDEAQKRISSKLKTYYEDFLDAEALEMSIELGENIRDQMGEIFKILNSSGISTK